jgi:DNA-binding NarL/FixJ family response regulator
MTTVESELRWALQALLDQFPSAALLVDDSQQVAFSNAKGRNLVASATGPAASAIASALRGEENPLGLEQRAGPSERGLTLLVGRETGDPRMRRSQTAATRWALTKRQSQVLTEMVLGRGNKDIAERLACSPKTIELHVSAILAAAGVGSRAEMLSLLLSEG